jgi:hypothetical protein
MADTQLQRRLRHLKRGTTYVEIGHALVQCDTSLTDMADVIVYRSETDGSLWVRPPDEVQGRFEDLSAQPAASAPALSPAAADALAERQRQVEVEGWTSDHDDQHRASEIARAACCYADPLNEDRERPPVKWPWDRSWWKPKGRRRDLVRAAGRLIAEIERLDRLDARLQALAEPRP